MYAMNVIIKMNVMPMNNQIKIGAVMNDVNTHMVKSIKDQFSDSAPTQKQLGQAVRSYIQNTMGSHIVESVIEFKIKFTECQIPFVMEVGKIVKSNVTF